MSCTCRNCKKPISADVSVEIGLGPICRRNLKVKERGTTRPLFRSKYNYWHEGDVLVITDQNGPVSLTNDMENVLEYLRRTGNITSTNQTIIYKDSQGIWDGVKLESL